MADVFSQIFGQPRVREFLRASVASDRVTHAYLFTGPAGSNKTQAAYALASALICKDNGCGACDECSKIARRKHPDVRYYAPEGAGGYLVEQIREIVSDTSLAPIQATRKVYILDRVDLLGTSAANAFLKTLEEPPDDVVIILLGRTRESVLPTIVSRCSVAADILAQRTGASFEQARIAIEACGGSITRGIEFMKSNERLSFRRQVLDTLARLDTSDSWDLVSAASDLVVAAKAPLDSVRAAHEAELAENADFLAKSAIRQIEARNKRELSARERSGMMEAIASAESLLRDVLVRCEGAGQLVNADVTHVVGRLASSLDSTQVLRALDACSQAADDLAHNVSPQLTLEVWLLNIKEAYACPA